MTFLPDPTVKYSRGWESKGIAQKQKHFFSAAGIKIKSSEFT